MLKGTDAPLLATALLKIHLGLSSSKFMRQQPWGRGGGGPGEEGWGMGGFPTSLKGPLMSVSVCCQMAQARTHHAIQSERMDTL